jgi:hypothetical protein
MRKGLLDFVGVEGWLMYDCASSGAEGVLCALDCIGDLCTATAPCART